MASARVNFSVGLFMTAGLALATLAIIWLGMTSFLRQGELFVTYFDESVQGLNVDSPVKYRGVPVGRVKAIRIAPDYHLIEVVILVDDEHTGDENRFAGTEAALANVGITGAMFVEIDKRSPGETSLAPRLDFQPEYPVIPSKPSQIRKLFREIDDIATKIQAIDFQGISEQFMGAARSFNAAMNGAQIEGIATDIRTLLASINAAANPKRLDSITKNLDQTVIATRTLMEKTAGELARMDEILLQFQALLAANRPSIDTTMGALASTAVKADAFMSQGQTAMAQTQSTIRALAERLTTSAENLEQTSANLNSLVNAIKAQPSELLFGSPKAPRKVEE